MTCYHKSDPNFVAPAGGNWSNDFYILKNYPDILLVNIKKIAAMDDSPFGQYPISSEVSFTDVNNEGSNSGYLPFKPDSFYTVGQENGGGTLMVHSRLQKPDTKGQNRAIDVYLCD